MSRFLTSIQLIATLLLTILLLLAHLADRTITGNPQLEIAGYIALIGGVFLFTVNLLTGRVRSLNISGKLSLFFHLVMVLIGAILLEPIVRNLFVSFVEEPITSLLIASAIMFGGSLFLISPTLRRQNREFERMMRRNGRGRFRLRR